MIAWALFDNPTILTFDGLLWLVLPLCASVAVVYKTVRVEHLRRLHVEILVLIAYMVGGLAALGAGLWAVYEYWPF